jgi:hypothetical protein
MFLQAFQANHQEHPDAVAARMLIANNSWSATRKYLGSHFIMQSVGSTFLTVKLGAADQKHLPNVLNLVQRYGKEVKLIIRINMVGTTLTMMRWTFPPAKKGNWQNSSQKN